MFSGRVGANNTAERDDGCHKPDRCPRVLGINPIGYLIVPRFMAMIVMLFSDRNRGLVALTGGAITCRAVLGIDMRIYWQGILDAPTCKRIHNGPGKGHLLEAPLPSSLSLGLASHWRRRGVSRAVNDSVVTSSRDFMVNFFYNGLWT